MILRTVKTSTVVALLLSGVWPAAAGARLHGSTAHPTHALSYSAECQTAIDRVDDLVSNPAAAVYLTEPAAERLARGLALCRSGHADDGAALLRKTFAAIQVAD